ncbi:Fructose-2,6-bisphosphatase TIGAR [Amphibalanus amphitrite]|uniref:Fructose-2,6-bisphosphatase TIGAR n=2 Tax=Amphibalanus amphitrite TaxID=1232801 RepID=A0A6A4VGU9_AMPAM|nr:Fructose-2,6-bisphosphatase TIGAR [Amphibalanus amphitrite]
MAPLLWLIYCNDLDEDINTNTTRSLYADDTALLATGRSLQACADQLQPDLDQVARWLDKWKVEASPSKCVFTTFSLHAKEVNGKVVPTLTFKGDQLAHEKNPTFLGLTLDSQLTFTNHIEEVKKRMAQRRRCLTALAGRSYGSDQATLRAAYIAYIRSVADYGAALYSTHAAPSVRARLEAEQHKCARVITGCIRLTNSETLITEAGLPPLAVRGREIAAMEQERLARLPPGDPARALTERHVRPRLKHRAHEAWQRARTEARRRGEPPPDPPSEDTALPFKPCFRRVSQWMAKEAGLADLPREPLALVPEQPPWTNPADAVTFRLSLPRATRRDDPPAVRKAAALEAIAMVNPDCTIWSDGSAKSGTRDGGGGALIQLHRENREVETLVPAGSVCSSMRAELAAMLAAFTCLLAQPGETRSRIKTCLLCTDSLSGLQLLQRGPEAQQLVLAERVWAAMDSLGEQNTAIILQWVPGHADIAGNEAADRLANRAAAECAQSETPIDLASARTAIRQRAREMQATRAHRHPHPQPTPGLQDLPRWGQVTVSQLRTGYCPLARATLHRLELTPDPLCRECGAEDTVRHLLTECPAFATTRRRLWGGPLPSLDEVLSGPAGKIVDYIRRVGRSEPPLDQPPSDAPAGASTGQCTSNLQHLVSGRTDSSLTEQGQQEAELLGKYFRKNNIPIDRIYSSPLIRAYKTALELAGDRQQVIVDPRLIEKFYGVCEGIPEAEWFEMMQKSGKDVYHYTPEGGEPSESVHQRITDFFWSIVNETVPESTAASSTSGSSSSDRQAPRRTTVAAVTHGAVLYGYALFFMMELGALKLENPEATPICNTGVCQFDFWRDANGKLVGKMIYLNRLDHINGASFSVKKVAAGQMYD